MRVGVDIGGTKIAAVAIDADDRVLAESRSPVRPGPDGVIAGAIGAIDDVGRIAGCPPDTVGIGVPGAIRSLRGRQPPRQSR